MKTLFITRTYPPLVGGMEKFAQDFYVNYQKQGEIDLLANSGGKKKLVLFFFKTVFFLTLHSREYDLIHIYDAVLAFLIPIIRLFSKAKITFTVNGLDIVYSGFGYQRLVLSWLNGADKIFPISRYTMEQCVLRGISEDRLRVMPVGVDFDVLNTCSFEEKRALKSQHALPENSKILLTVGRLVKRKGHAWFIENVFVKLPKNFLYCVIGDGPEYIEIDKVIRKLDLAERVHLLGNVSDKERDCWYQIADFFIMPNIHVAHDQEGFGIVLLEAGRYGLPVIVSDIEGIHDVVLDGKSGLLVREKDVQGFLDAIFELTVDRTKISPSLAKLFSWERVSGEYYKEFLKLVNPT